MARKIFLFLFTIMLSLQLFSAMRTDKSVWGIPIDRPGKDDGNKEMVLAPDRKSIQWKKGSATGDNLTMEQVDNEITAKVPGVPAVVENSKKPTKAELTSTVSKAVNDLEDKCNVRNDKQDQRIAANTEKPTEEQILNYIKAALADYLVKNIAEGSPNVTITNNNGVFTIAVEASGSVDWGNITNRPTFFDTDIEHIVGLFTEGAIKATLLPDYRTKTETDAYINTVKLNLEQMINDVDSKFSNWKVRQIVEGSTNVHIREIDNGLYEISVDTPAVGLSLADVDNEITKKVPEVPAVAKNTAKVGITPEQVQAIEDNSKKTGITAEQANEIAENTKKVGITPEQVQAIEDNSKKTGITAEQANEIAENTRKVGITPKQAGNIEANNAKPTTDDVVYEIESRVPQQPAVLANSKKPTLKEVDKEIDKKTVEIKNTIKDELSHDFILIEDAVKSTSLTVLTTDVVIASGYKALSVDNWLYFDTEGAEQRDHTVRFYFFIPDRVKNIQIYTNFDIPISAVGQTLFYRCGMRVSGLSKITGPGDTYHLEKDNVINLVDTLQISSRYYNQFASVEVTIRTDKDNKYVGSAVYCFAIVINYWEPKEG